MEKMIAADERRFLAPEVVQTSSMDCGPAALKAMLEGFGLAVDYGRLREACQTDVDGTSIDTIEDVATRLGLACQQVLAPIDHLFVPSARLLPAIVVTLQPSGFTHFVIVWRVIGSWVQIMDPAQGRRWLKRSQLQQSIYRYRFMMLAADWRVWAGGDGFCTPLRARMQQLGISEQRCEALLARALGDSHWRALAALDAAVRFARSLMEAGGITGTAEIEQLVEWCVSLGSDVAQNDGQSLPGELAALPAAYWSVLPAAAQAAEVRSEEEMVNVYGAVVLTATGRTPLAAVDVERSGAESAAATAGKSADIKAQVALPRGLRAALRVSPGAGRAILQALRDDGLLVPGMLLLIVIASAFSVTLEAVILRGLMDIHTWLVRDSLRATLAVSIFAFTLLLFLLETTLTGLSLRLGRRLETRLRVALLTKIPQIEERYFHSRLISDMAYRAYSLTQLHSLPGLGAALLRLSMQLFFTTLGVIWLAPQGAIVALAVLGTVIGVTLMSQPLTSERDLRVRTHAGALSRFYLDALLGLLPIRSHSAERVMRREHEVLLGTWTRAMRELANIELILQTLVAGIGIGGACGIVLLYLSNGGEVSGVLLLLYWSLALPALSQSFVSHAQQYPRLRNHLLRVLEPLSAPVKGDEVESAATPAGGASELAPGVAVELRGVTAVAAGHPILHDLNLTIAPGEHLAIIGASGSGKSSLVGLLLGVLYPAQGEIWIDGNRLTAAHLESLRRTTAWVDPAVMLWNRSLAANLLYGLSGAEQEESLVWEALALADLDTVIARLTDGLSTPLGEGGGLISAGEGQRVRFSRALMRPSVRLAILDEPFRGLDRAQRHQLLVNARKHWSEATLLCITHDVAETQQFDRVLILEEGRIAEVGAPEVLIQDPQSRYRAWLDAFSESWESLWNDPEWRRLHLEGGKLVEP